MMDVLIPILTMGVLALLFSIGLSFAYQKLKVKEDPKVEKINEILPQVNCGACGYSGCRAFAEAVANEKAEITGCPVGGEEVSKKIAEIMGTEAETTEKKAARLHCRGSHEAAKNKGNYLGITTCYAAHIIGGNKQCVYGCLGYGDCEKACPFDAIKMGEAGLPIVNEERCTACGKCVEACPRNLFELHPISQNIMVFCRSRDSAAAAKKACKNACISCGICVRACPEAIALEDNLAVIKDYKKIDPEKIPAIEKCPTDAIGRIKKEENHER
jgi:Na+-translocating ferredoxin:NAD+ oxidoreductase subunit B